MKKRLFAILLALALVVSLMPLSALAAYDWELTVQAVVVKDDGTTETNSLKSKDYNGTTIGETGSGEPEWTWVSNGKGGYTVSAQYDGIINAPIHFVYPSELWDYNSEEYEFFGMGNTAGSTRNDYSVKADAKADATIFNGTEFTLASRSSSKYVTYVFHQKDTEPEEPITYPVVYSWRNLPKDADIQVPATQYYEADEQVIVDTTYYKGYSITVDHYIYTFQGWDTSVLDEQFNGLMPAAGLTILGSWSRTGEEPKYSVTYKFEGDAPDEFTPNIDNFGIFTKAQYQGYTWILPSGLKAESDEGTWTFNGWTSDDVEFINGGDRFILPDHDVELVGTWTFTPNEAEGHSITYAPGSDEGDVTGMPESGEAAVGTDQTVSAATPARDGYIFDGWTSEEVKLDEDGGFTMPDVDVTFTAQWVQVKDVNVKYASAGIYFNLYLDGVKIEPENFDDYVTLKYDGGTKVENRDAGRLIRYEYEDLFYNCLDVGVSAQPGYVIEEIDAWTVFGQDGTIGIIKTEPGTEQAEYGEYFIDNAFGAGSAGNVAEIFLRTEYEVKFFDADGSEITDEGAAGLITGSTDRKSFGSVDNVVNKTDESGFYHVNCGCASTSVCEHIGFVTIGGSQTAEHLGVVWSLDDSVTMPAAPEGRKWYLNGEEFTGSEYEVSADDADDGVISFYAEETEEAAAVITHEYVLNYMAKNDDGKYETVKTETHEHAFDAVTGLYEGETYTIPAEYKTPVDGYTDYSWDKDNPSQVVLTAGENEITLVFNKIVTYEEYTVEHRFYTYVQSEEGGEYELDRSQNRTEVFTYTALSGDTVTIARPDYEGYTVDPEKSSAESVTIPAGGAGYHVTYVKYVPYEGGEPVVPDEGITGFDKDLVTSSRVYRANHIAYPEFRRGGVTVDEGDGVTLIYRITVKGAENTEYTIRDQGAKLLSGSWTGRIGADGAESILVAKTFSWYYVRHNKTLDNSASVSVDGETVKSDIESIGVDIDWDNYIPVPDDDDDVTAKPGTPEGLDTEEHFAYIVGYEDGTIRPGANITRAEVATIFFRLLTDEARDEYWSSESGFTDVESGDWFNNAVSTLAKMGILGGYEDGSFRPNAPITRAEFTKIAVSFFEKASEIAYDGRFTDIAGSEWYADAVAGAAYYGLIDGYGDGTFRPGANITRAEACTIVNRVLGRAPHEDHLLPAGEMLTWPDNKPGAWYYADMQEATNSHDYEWAGEIENWLEKLPERDWDALEREWSDAHSAPGGEVMG